MTHMRQMSESEGTTAAAKPSDTPCPQCRARQTTCQEWESSCGGYVDWKYTCGACGWTWWIDGIDS